MNFWPLRQDGRWLHHDCQIQVISPVASYKWNRRQVELNNPWIEITSIASQASGKTHENSYFIQKFVHLQMQFWQKRPGKEEKNPYFHQLGDFYHFQ